MLLRKRILTALTVFTILLAIFAPSAEAKGNEFDAVCKHLKTRYQAKKVKIPFMWLARAAVGIVRPAGLKSFKVTVFRNLRFSEDSLHSEMQSIMSDAFSDEWSPILRVRSRVGEQVYMNMRESGKNVKVLLVSIERDEAVVVRAKFNPDKLVRFIENPKIFGISLDGDSKKSDRKKALESSVQDDSDIRGN